MSPRVKSGKDFDEALSTKRNPAPLHEPQHLPPPPPAPRLSLPALGSFTTPPTTTITTPHDTPSSSPSFNTNITATTSTTASSTTSSLDYDDSYTAFYSSIPTVADSLYTAIVPTTPISSSTAASTTSTTTPGLTPTAANSNNPYLYYPYSTSFTASAEYQYHASLGSKTPMQVVAMSNHKLNSDIYSTRSLSIHRRILVKNLLTLLYEMNPMLDWFDDGSSGYDVGMYEGDEGDVSNSSEPLLAEEEQDGWIEQTLSAAGLSEDDDEEIVKKMKKHGRSDKAKTTTPTTTPTKTTTKSNSTKIADGRGSVASNNSSSNSNSDYKKNKKTDTAAHGSGVDQSTPSIKNASKSITTPPPPPTRPTQNSGSSSSSSISSVLPSFPPAPTNRAYSLPNLPATSAQAPSTRAPPSLPRTTYTLSPPSSSSSASSTTSTSSNGSYTSSSSSGSSLLMSGGRAAPLPRPKSIELPQSLNNYLAAVFDVDWSVELPTMEDSLFTFKGPLSSSSPPSPGTLSPPGTSSYMNGSLLSSAPKRRSFSSSTSTISSSTFSTLSKHSPTSSSSSLSSVDSWNKSPPFVATETTTTTTPRGTLTSGEIMVAKSVQQPYHGNSHASLIIRGAAASGTTTTGLAKSLPSIRQDTQQRTSPGSGNVPIKGGAVPRAGDGQNTLKVNTTGNKNTSLNNSNNNNNNRQPATSAGTSPPKQTIRKTTLVPGRRSSLLHTGQMPSASGTRKSPTSGPVAVPGSNPTPTTVTITKINTSGMGFTTSTNGSASPTSPPPQANTSFANGYVSPSSSNNGSGGGGGVHGGHQQPGIGPVSGSGSGGPASPNIAKRTSSLQPMERPALGQRNPSTENVASSAGLPRPLLAKSFSSPIVIGPGGATTNQSPPASLPAIPSSGTNAVGGNEYYETHQHHNHQSNGFSAGGFPVVSARGHPQAPRKMAALPPSNFTPITPPRSPSRGAVATASTSPYGLMPVPVLSSLPSYGPSASGAPTLPPLFSVQNEDKRSSSGLPSSPYSRRSPPPSSPSSPTINGVAPYNYQQQTQQQYLATPHVYTRSTSDDQTHPRSTAAAPTRSSSPPSPPLSSTSPSPTGSSTSSTATSLSHGSQPPLLTTAATSTTTRSSANYGMKASKSSPDLTTGLSSDWYFVNALGQTSTESLAQRPLPSLPPLYQPYSQQQHQKQQSYTYQPQTQSHQHPQRQQSYSYGGSDKVSRGGGGYKTGMTSAPLPLPRVTMSSPVAGPSSSQISGGGGSRWATMKTMFSLKTTTGHGGK
ncbi:hypothetical protein K457DRAFT_18716 [Linnemannia elongata AG-77]|uniref:Uncharacterized protein n=1 Tax=Linnemannia elongata AG-77 TaxID=1314771 RepID=A0A197JXB2_9FUNG|nr:hypothetical protein K457DRAFT_18716 [Linnemannia elongata AG-77]